MFLLQYHDVSLFLLHKNKQELAEIFRFYKL